MAEIRRVNCNGSRHELFIETLFPSGDYHIRCGAESKRYNGYTKDEAIKLFKKQILEPDVL